MADSERYRQGASMRRKLMGEAAVDAAAKATP